MNLDNLTQQFFNWILSYPPNTIFFVIVGILFFASIIESLPVTGMFFPSESLTIFFGILSFKGIVNIIILIIVAYIGILLGDIIGYYIGKKVGEEFLRKHFKKLKIDNEKYNKMKRLLDENLLKALFIGRSNGFTRWITPFLAGANNIKIEKFILLNMITAGFWSPLFLLGGYFLGDAFEMYGKYFGITIIIITISIFIIYKIYKYFVKKKYLKIEYNFKKKRKLMLIGFLVIFAIYISFRIGLDIYESFYIKEEATKEAVLMGKKEFLEAGLYAVYKKIVDVFDALSSFLVVVVLLSGGLWLINYFDKNNSLFTIFAYFLLVYLLSLPVEIYSKIIDKKFGFNKSSWKLFIIDEVKKIVIFAIIGGGIFYALTYFIDNFKNWWLISFVFVFVVILAINMLYPIFMTLFNKFTPLENETLKNDIENIMNKVGFKANGIFVMDASKRDSRLNAFFGGFGKTKRVVLFDTLIEKLTPKEILAVLGHELGHFKHKDIIKNIAMMGVMMFGLFFIIGNLPDSLFKELNIQKSAGNILVLAFIIGEIYFYFLSPLINLISRKNEFAADEMGAKLGDAKNLKSALIKLVKENKSFPKSSKIYSIIYHSHPSVLERIEKLEKQ